MGDKGQWDGNETVSEMTQVTQQPDTWLNAIRGLRENPIATYWPLMFSRRVKKSRRGWRRFLRLGWGLLGIAVVCFMIWPVLRDSGLPINEQWMLMSLALVVPLFVIWNYVGQLFVFREALGSLNRVVGERRVERIDEMLCISRLTDREVLVGLLRVMLPPLLIRVIAAVLLFQGCVMMLAYEISGVPDMHRSYAKVHHGDEYERELAKRIEFWHSSRNKVVVSSPLLISGMLLTGTLATVMNALWLIMLGRRRLSHATIAVEAYLVAGLQALGSLFYVFLTIGQFAGHAFYNAGSMYLERSIEYGLGIFLLIIVATLVCSWRWPLIRNSVPLGLPLIMAGSGVMVLRNTVNLFSPEATGKMTGYFLHVCYSAFGVANPLAIPYTGCMGNWAYHSVAENGYVHTWRFEIAIIVAIQVVMILVLGRMAQRSVKCFRQGIV